VWGCVRPSSRSWPRSRSLLAPTTRGGKTPIFPLPLTPCMYSAFTDRRRGDYYLGSNDYDRGVGGQPQLLAAIASGMHAIARSTKRKRVTKRKTTKRKKSKKSKKTSKKSALTAADKALLRAAAQGSGPNAFSMNKGDMSMRSDASGGDQTLTVKPSQFVPTTADYLLAYGNPFVTLEDMKVSLPRVPDLAFTGSSAAIHYEITENINATVGEFFVLKSSRFGGIAGMDIVGGDGWVWPQTAAAELPLADFKAGVEVFANRQLQNTFAYGRFSQLGPKTVAGRYVSSGLKLHDLGPLETSAGQILATRCGDSLLPLAMKAAQADPVMWKATCAYGPAVCFWQGSSPTDATNSASPTMGIVNWQRKVKSVCDAAQTPQGNRWNEFVSSDGTSLRISTSGTDRPFANLPPPVIFQATATTTATARTINSYATTIGYEGRNFFAEYVEPIIDEVGAAYGIDTQARQGVIDWGTDTVSDLFFSYLGIQWAAAGEDPAVEACILCDINGIPLWCYQDAVSNGLQAQGDAPFMVAYANGQTASTGTGARAFKTYGCTFEEIIPNQLNPMSATPAPNDANWDDVAKLSAAFIGVTKGFTFFSKLLDGVGDALKFTVKNGSKIFGLAKTVGSLIA